MMDYYNLFYTFALFLCLHFVCDYPLQGDFLAKYKARWVNDGPNKIWLHCITAHSAIHALPVLLITGSLGLGAFMFVTHWIIDTLKCEGKISLNMDQFLHFCVIAIITAYYVTV